MGGNASIHRFEGKHAGQASNLVAAGMVIAGDVVFSGSLRIDGAVRGNVRAVDDAPATLVIGVQGSVDGSIDVARLVIHGAVTGHVKARDFIKLHATARARCDVEYAVAEIQAGAIIQGRFVLRPESPSNRQP
ncbi:MAG: polymer-forming cytoskeletal protein [Rhodocyclaceae bacterium]|nr:polymer-forming cytoskeletal protein [Rhodocyclaceae bacterium]